VGAAGFEPVNPGLCTGRRDQLNGTICAIAGSDLAECLVQESQLLRACQSHCHRIEERWVFPLKGDAVDGRPAGRGRSPDVSSVVPEISGKSFRICCRCITCTEAELRDGDRAAYGLVDADNDAPRLHW
jgi:hypothetical protein